MRALIAYESMYGNTHAVADAIGEGLRGSGDWAVDVRSIHDVTDPALDAVDLLVVGGPTHVHGMSHSNTRGSAATAATREGSDLELDPDMAGEGVREWLGGITVPLPRAAAFDTRLDANAVLTGRASKGIAKALRRHGAELVTEPESFLVSKENHLLPTEWAHALRWGQRLGAEAVAIS